MTEFHRCITNTYFQVMRRTVRNIATIFTLLLCSANSIYAQERPKLKELNAKKQEQAAAGILPAQKKDKWGYVDAEGKVTMDDVVYADKYPEHYEDIHKNARSV